MSDMSCTCFLGFAPCGYCEHLVECQGCGAVYYDGDHDFSETAILFCLPCQVKFRTLLESHQLDCTCRACIAFVTEDDAEAGFVVAIPILIEMENANVRPE